MKYRILAVIVILVALFSINVSAATYEYSISPSDNFTTAQHGDDLTEISQKLNMSADDLNSYFNKNGLIYLAVSDDAKTQIRLSAFTDNFSSAVNDIAYLDDVGITEFVNAVSEDAQNPAVTIINNDRKFVCVKSTHKDSGGIYTVTQYITICNNKTFYLAGYNEGEDTSADITAAFESFYLSEKEMPTPNYTLPIILIIIGITVFLTLAVLMIIGIIRLSTKTKKNNNQDDC